MAQKHIELSAMDSTWLAKQCLFAEKYLADRGISFAAVNNDSSQLISTIAAVLYVEDNERTKYWVLTGDIANDHLRIEAANSAREAIRHFALKWQLQSEKLLEAKDKLQYMLGLELANKAKLIQHLYEDDVVWQ